MAEGTMRRWLTVVIGIAALAVAIQMVPYGHDYAGLPEQSARGVEPTSGVADDDNEEAGIPA